MSCIPAAAALALGGFSTGAIAAIAFLQLCATGFLLGIGRDGGKQRNLPAEAPYSVEPCILWFTGLPSSGKTTLSVLTKELFESCGAKVEHLDGDAVRAVLPGTGFSRDQRNDHIRRMGFLASRFQQQGIVVIASFVSPYRESRDFARRISQNFLEIYLSTDLSECSRRDVKGLYKQASGGTLSNMTGVDDPYEPPMNPDLILDTATFSKEECLAAITDLLSKRNFLRTSTEVPGASHGSHLATRAG